MLNYIQCQNCNIFAFSQSTIPITDVTMESLIGPIDSVYHKIAKVFRFNLTIPDDFQNDIIFNLTNKDFLLDKYVDFCNIQVKMISLLTFFYKLMLMDDFFINL